jgi:hypothetical protein
MITMCQFRNCRLLPYPVANLSGGCNQPTLSLVAVERHTCVHNSRYRDAHRNAPYMWQITWNIKQICDPICHQPGSRTFWAVKICGPEKKRPWYWPMGMGPQSAIVRDPEIRRVFVQPAVQSDQMKWIVCISYNISLETRNSSTRLESFCSPPPASRYRTNCRRCKAVLLRQKNYWRSKH